jgi:HD-GYP domain-containing protein (c-di-GMP phosphodiesterase class II)
VQDSSGSSFDTADAGTLVAASRRYRLAIADLQLGMFVAELDRPWVDTPFLLQGFLVDNPDELDTLRRVCRYVYVDLEMSNPEVADTIRRVEDKTAAPARDTAALRPSPVAARIVGGGSPAPQPALPPAAATATRRPVVTGPRVPPRRAETQVSADTRQRFRQLVLSGSGSTGTPRASLVDRVLGWLRRLRGDVIVPLSHAPERERAGREAIRAQLKPGVPLEEYPVKVVFEDALPQARASFTRSHDVLRTIAVDIKSGKIPQVAEVARAVDDMVGSMIDNPDALMWISRLREENLNTYNKGVTVALYLIALGRQLGLPRKELSSLGMIGMLADVGNMKIDRSLLEKPRTLTPAEYAQVKLHVGLGLESLQEAGTLPPEVVLGISQHHERLDGSGYPGGLKGDEISIYGRMAGVADVFAALITPRAYANAIPPQDALMNLFEWSGTLFHEPLVEQFVQAVGVFPVGSLVELSTGEVAIVVAHNRVRRLEPRVLVLTWPDKTSLSQPIERDLLTQGRASGNRVRIVRGLSAGAYGLKMRDFYVGEVARANDLAA